MTRDSTPLLGRRRWLPRTVLACTLLAVAATTPLAADTDLPTPAEARLINANTVGMVFPSQNIYQRLVEDMAAEFAETSALRVVPILGVNQVQTIYDLLYMRGVDLGFVHADTFEFMSRVKGYERVYRRIRSLAEVTTEKVAIIAGEDYRTLDDLDGLKVNVQEPGGGADVTSSILFDTLGLEIEKTRLPKLEALEKVKSGELAAMVHLVDEPLEVMRALSPADRLRLIALPQTEPLLRHYRASKLTSEDFPGMIRGEGAVPSLEVPVIIAAYNWPQSRPERYAKTERFVTALLDGFEGLREGRDATYWQQASLDRAVPGIERLPMVDTILAEREAQAGREATAAAAARLAEIEAQQEALLSRLNERLESGDGDVSEAAELEKLLEQVQTILNAD